MPNREVKPSSADGTARETGWESRSLPLKYRSPTRETGWGFRFSYSLALARRFAPPELERVRAAGVPARPHERRPRGAVRTGAPARVRRGAGVEHDWGRESLTAERARGDLEP